MTEAAFDRFVSEALARLTEVEQPEHSHRFVLAGAPIEIRCSCPELWARMENAIGHWPRVEAWNAATGAPFVLHAATDRSLGRPLQAPDWQSSAFTQHGMPLTDAGTPVSFDLKFQPWQKMIQAHRDGEAIYWVADPSDLPWWEATFPFRSVLHWWTAGKPLQLMHAAAVSPNGREAFLIPGPSGSGKSTTVVTLLEHGCASQGDDYVLVQTDEPHVFPLYNTLKLTDEAVDTWLSHRKDRLHKPVPEAKWVGTLSDWGALGDAMPLAGVLVPEIRRGEGPAIGRISAAAAAMAIAPTTLHHLPERREESWAKMTRLLGQLPVWRWRLERDLALNALRFKQFEHLGTPEKVAVIVPAFNPGEGLARALASIAAQDWIAAEHRVFVVDDASTDGAALERLAGAASGTVEVLRMAVNSGPAGARNAGLRAAWAWGADWAAFCDDDDVWPETKWRTQRAAATPDIQLVGGRIRYHVAEGVDDPIDHYLNDDREISHVHLGALIARRSVFETVGLLDESMRFSEDFDWWNRVREAGIPLTILDVPTLHYFVHGRNSIQGKSARELGVLDVLAKSLQRRRAKAGSALPIRTMRDEGTAWRYDVVVPVYNGRPFLPDVLAMLAESTVPPQAVIFVDDASTDGSGDWLAEALAAPEWAGRAELIRLAENRGVAHARNVGWKAGRSAWCAFLDQDDLWPADKCQRQLEALRAGGGKHQWATTFVEPELAEGFTWPAHWKPELQLPHKCTVPSGWMVSRVALYDVGGFDEAYQISDDLKFAGQMRDRFGAEVVCEDVKVRRRFGPHNNSHRQAEMKRETLQTLHERIRQARERVLPVFIIVTVYNGDRHLREALDSIAASTYPHWTAVVVDDGSMDGSAAIAAEFAAADPRWRVISQANRGVAAALNAGLALLPESAQAVAFLDHDDRWAPTKLERQIPLLRSGAQAVGTLVTEFDDFAPGEAATHAARSGSHRAMLKSNAVVARDLALQLGTFNEGSRIGDFIEWLAPAMRNGLVIRYVEEALLERRVHARNMTGTPDHGAMLAMLRQNIQSKRGQ